MHPGGVRTAMDLFFLKKCNFETPYCRRCPDTLAKADFDLTFSVWLVTTKIKKNVIRKDDIFVPVYSLSTVSTIHSIGFGGVFLVYHIRGGRE